MELVEKLVESGRTVNNAIWVFLSFITVLSAYLIQRTIKFAGNEDLYSDAILQQQSQIQHVAGPIKLEFTYATMNIAWIWALGVSIFLTAALIYKRNNIYEKLLSIELINVNASLLMPFDFFNRQFIRSINPVLWLPFLLVFIVCLLQLFPIAFYFITEERYIEGVLIILGSIYSLYAFVKLILALRKTA